MATAAKKSAPKAGSSKAHMKEEMAALKKGGASKKLMAEERAEHKAEGGYKRGGMVKGKK